MKIGIITFWETQDNYGQILQNYALQQVLRKMGHQPFLIKYSLFRDWCYDYPGRWKNAFDAKRLFAFLKRTIKGNMNPSKHNMTTTQIDRGFNAFKDTYLSSTEKIYDLAELKANPPEADMYICGSDMIWYCPDNYHIYKKLLHAYFLGFGAPEKKRIAYAPSFGRTDFPDGYYDIIRDDFLRLDAISVRESMGIKTCERLGRRDAVHVLDPTCLLKQKDYDLIKKNSKSTSPYIFIYIVGKLPVSIQEIIDYAHDHHLRIVFSGSQLNEELGTKDGIIESVYPSIEQWIGYMAGSDMVVTNSFHGTVFSIIYNKDNIILVNNKKKESGGNTRLLSFLNSIGLSNRVYDHNLQELLKQPIEWGSVTHLLQQQIDKSTKFLVNSIKS